MRFAMTLPNRQTARLRSHDYSRSGAYFVTICAHRRALLFGRIVDAASLLNAMGLAVQDAWRHLPSHFPGIVLDTMVVMPNHVHAILELDGTRPLGQLVGAWKSFSARRINHLRGVAGPVWQRGFYDRVIRDQEERQRIREYIAANPASWDADEENPERGAG